MADKKISQFPQTTTPAKTDKLLIEELGGAFQYQTREQLHKVHSGEAIDSASGVNLVLKSEGVVGLTIPSGSAAITVARATLFNAGVTFAQTASPASFNNGLVDINDRFFIPSVRSYQTYSGSSSGAGVFSLVVPPLPNGASAAALAVASLAQVTGTVEAETHTLTLIAADGSSYTDTASITPSNLGENVGASLQALLDSVKASFLTGEGRAVASGDSLLVYATGGANNQVYALGVEVRFT